MSNCSMPQMKVDQTPRFDNAKRKKKWGSGVLSKKSGIIRPDKRRKPNYVT